MQLIPGLGCGDDVWNEFMERHRADVTMYAITLPGFGGTKPLAMPADTSFSRVPTLVVQPGFDDPGFYVEERMDYMRNLCRPRPSRALADVAKCRGSAG